MAIHAPPTHPCKYCGTPSVGTFYDAVDGSEDFVRTHVCNRHWYARKSKEDKEYEAQCDKQWGDQPWYKEQFPERFGSSLDDSLEEQLARRRAAIRDKITTVDKPEKPQQQSLF